MDATTAVVDLAKEIFEVGLANRLALQTPVRRQAVPVVVEQKQSVSSLCCRARHVRSKTVDERQTAAYALGSTDGPRGFAQRRARFGGRVMTPRPLGAITRPASARALRAAT